MIGCLLAAIIGLSPNAISGHVIAPAQFAKSGDLFHGYFPHPTGRNGYEEYLQAADLTRTPEFKAYSMFFPRIVDSESGRQLMNPDTGEPAPWPPAPAGLSRKSSQLDVQRAWLKQYGRILDLVKSGNLKPASDPRTEFTLSSTFPELSDFKTVVKFMGTAAYVQFASGAGAEGTDTLLQALKFLDALGGVTLIHTLVQYSGQAILMAQFSECLAELSEPDCRRVIAVVDAILSAPPAMARAIERERTVMIGTVSKLNGSEWAKLIDDFGFQMGQSDSFNDFVKGLNDRQWNDIKRETVTRLNKEYDAWLGSVLAPESQWKPLLESTGTPEAAVPLHEGPPTTSDVVDFLVDTMVPLRGQVAVTTARIRTQLRLLKLHAFVIGFRWHNRRLPLALADAVPSSELMDPFSGEPFQYQLLPGGYRLFSKGFGKTGEIELRYQRPVSSDEGANNPPTKATQQA